MEADDLRCYLGLVGGDSDRVGSDIVTRFKAVRCSWNSISGDILEPLNGSNIGGVHSSEGIRLGHIHGCSYGLASSNGLEVLGIEAGLLVVHDCSHEFKICAIYIWVCG